MDASGEQSHNFEWANHIGNNLIKSVEVWIGNELCGKYETHQQTEINEICKELKDYKKFDEIYKMREKENNKLAKMTEKEKIKYLLTK